MGILHGVDWVAEVFEGVVGSEEADRPAKVGCGLTGGGVAGTGASSLSDVLRATAGVERERRLASLGRAGESVPNRPFPGVFANPHDVRRLADQPGIQQRRTGDEGTLGFGVVIRPPDDVPQISRRPLALRPFAAIPFLSDGDWHEIHKKN